MRLLNSYEEQTVKPAYIIVVNNASTDETKLYLKNWKTINSEIKKYVINLSQNTGGSGGFFTGLKFAMDLDADWVWVGDDDAYAERSAFKILDEFLSSVENEEMSAVCAKIIEHGEIARSHRKNVYQKGLRIVEDRLEANDYSMPFEINSFSYVGTAISVNKMKQAGLPKKEYFIWYDDAEHSMRLSKIGKIVCLPNIIVEHDNEILPSNANTIDWKRYYGIRNFYDFYKTYFPTVIVNAQFLYKLLRVFIVSIKKGNFSLFKMYRQAIYDARHQKFGKSEIYYPGVKII